MLERDVVGIDFGASYTKAAFRPGFTPGAIQHAEVRVSEPLAFGNDVAPTGNPELVPTLVMETGEARRPWIFGNQAAGVVPARGWQVHSNWKADLIRDDGMPSWESLRVARVFFEWLRTKIDERVPFDLGAALVTICLPAFQDQEHALTSIAKVMEEAGWNNKFISNEVCLNVPNYEYCTSSNT